MLRSVLCCCHNTPCNVVVVDSAVQTCLPIICCSYGAVRQVYAFEGIALVLPAEREMEDRTMMKPVIKGSMLLLVSSKAELRLIDGSELCWRVLFTCGSFLFMQFLQKPANQLLRKCSD